MSRSTKERVQRFRMESGLIRVEVSVPDADDALAIRRFAQSRRDKPEDQPNDHVALASLHPEADDLADLVASLPADAKAIVTLFAAGLSRAKTAALRARAHRIAENFFDIATAHSRATQLTESNSKDGR